jgi:hypothetical protein
MELCQAVDFLYFLVSFDFAVIDLPNMLPLRISVDFASGNPSKSVQVIPEIVLGTMLL